MMLQVESLTYKNIELTVWDIGGQDKIRRLWRHYFTNTQGLIFVVDCNDHARLDEARLELHKLLQQDELRDACLLVYANKQDLPNAVSASEITEKFELTRFRTRKWFVQSCAATTGDGLYEGLDWMAKSLTDAHYRT
ncbi:hypothetical protein CTAYLR_009640 [Chrysophaeum taylorii]|uniref:ADP-ribosylation factor n=1 Tax=Chrysophaeum taylorii TaxID=2483200 RepID=A0AAD7U6Z4_9STRA|nr:hypothetical protein CTAYLR_009640 [Chrysophaeum taylorii]